MAQGIHIHSSYLNPFLFSDLRTQQQARNQEWQMRTRYAYAIDYSEILEIKKSTSRVAVFPFARIFFGFEESLYQTHTVGVSVSSGTIVESREREEMTWKWERIAGSKVLSSSSSGAAADQMLFFSVFHNYPLVSAILAFAIAQLIKFFTTWYKERRWDPKQLVGSGGMPSSHSSTVTALAVAIGLQEGFGGSVFAAAAILACVVMHDAFGVRLQAGRQAEVLNQIVYELPEEHPLADTRPLRELLGHTPLQVTAGGMLGLVVAVVSYLTCKMPNPILLQALYAMVVDVLNSVP